MTLSTARPAAATAAPDLHMPSVDDASQAKSYDPASRPATSSTVPAAPPPSRQDLMLERAPEDTKVTGAVAEELTAQQIFGGAMIRF